MTSVGPVAFDLVIVGSANMDLVALVDSLPLAGQTVMATGYSEHEGGKGLNQAVASARMGASCAFVGCVGDDAAGMKLWDLLRTEGIDLTGLTTVNDSTGRAMICVDSRAENMIVVVPGANAHVGRDSRLVLPKCRMVLAQLEIPIPAVVLAFQTARELGAMTVLNPAPAAPLPPELIALCDVITPNETESEILGGSTALLEAGVGAVVTTLGAKGATIQTQSSLVRIAPHKVNPIDTVGAGDAFVGAMCAELLRGASLEDACHTAAVAGALATTVRGAVPSLPTRAAVLDARQ